MDDVLVGLGCLYLEKKSKDINVDIDGVTMTVTPIWWCDRPIIITYAYLFGMSNRSG